VRKIQVTGSTVLSEEELAKVTAPYLNRVLTSEDLEALRLALTLAYVNKGYATSGAILPDQTVTEGVITFHIIEGKLSGIEVVGNEWFRAGYIRDRLALGAKPPVNIAALQERLLLLQQDPRIERLNAELKAGVQPGESVLKVRVAEASPFKGWLEFNNYQSPSVGAERGLVTVAHQNMTGNGDILSFQYGKSDGVDPQIDTRYAVPINAYDTTLIVQYRKNDFQVVEAPFTVLEIKSQSEIFGITVRQPVYRTLNQEFALALTGERLSNQTFLLGEPFSFSPGVRDGESIVSAVRFSQEWVHRAPNQVMAANSRFSFGVNALGATINDATVPDSQFFVWLGQFQFARRLDPWGVQLISRVDCQLANDRLFPLEQIAVGGRFSVRGYRENELVRDDGLIASLEVRLPVIRSALGAEIALLAPFVDFGRSWSRKTENDSGNTLTSSGVGVIWNIIQGSRLEMYWGHRWNSVPKPGNDLQDRGIHLQFIVQVL